MAGKGRNALNIILGFILVMVLAACAGFAAFFTNGFTSDFKTFYAVCREEMFLNDEENYPMIAEDEYRFDVRYTFGFLQKENKLGYTVKVIPNITDETEFWFYVNGLPKKYSAETELTSGFKIEQGEDYFTLTSPNDMRNILQSLYPGKTVTDVPEIINSEKAYFLLIIGSEDGKTELKIGFNVCTIRIEIEPGGVVI